MDRGDRFSAVGPVPNYFQDAPDVQAKPEKELIP